MIHHNPLRVYTIRLRIKDTPVKIVVGSNKMEPFVEFVKVESPDDIISTVSCGDVQSVMDFFGIGHNSIKTKRLDIKNQFTGKISNDKTKLIFNESITFSCFKHPDGPVIKNKSTHYGFWNSEYELLILLVERQMYIRDKKVSRSFITLVGEEKACLDFCVIDLLRRS